MYALMVSLYICIPSLYSLRIGTHVCILEHIEHHPHSTPHCARHGAGPLGHIPSRPLLFVAVRECVCMCRQDIADRQ